MVDEAVLGRVVLGLEGAEQRFLGAEDLDGARGVFSEVEQAARVADEPCADEVADERSQVGGNGGHTALEVAGELRTVGGDGNDLVTELVDVSHVGFRDVGTHRDNRGRLKGGLEVFWEGVSKVC